MRTITPESALKRLADAAARAEMCPADAAARLKRWGILSADAARIIARLTDEGYISPERYASAYVRDKYRFAGWGRRKIALGLAAKRIDRAIIAEALDEAVDADEYRARLVAVLRAKARTLRADLIATYEGKQKLYIFAASRGFESGIISSVLSTQASEVWPEQSSTD
ncbi:MAG: RecX family transcriptional regulator [Candidatus Amulumruptor sp.]|nr:RecX family transcriptional regulator [Candidatus Amulumruptor sp.]